MFQKYYNNFIKEQKSTETQKNFELISHLLNRLAKKATFDLETTALIHFNDYLYDIITLYQSSKENIASYDLLFKFV